MVAIAKNGFRLTAGSLLATVSYLHEVGTIAVNNSAEGHAISEGSSHVGDLHVSVTLCHLLAPFLQASQTSHPGHLRAHSHP